MGSSWIVPWSNIPRWLDDAFEDGSVYKEDKKWYFGAEELQKSDQLHHDNGVITLVKVR